MIQNYKKEVQSLFVIFLFKLLILALMPLTGDEAYFIKWAHNLSIGYYDHPPMVGWVLYLLSTISDSYIFFRLFAVFTTFVAAFVIYKIALLYEVQKERAFLTALIFLASPVDLLLILMTNDVVLLFFGSLGTLFLLYSLEKERWFFYALLSGLFLGAAFLSKYFAVFLLTSLLLFSLFAYKKKAIKSTLVAALLIFMFIAQNLYFNYTSCWNNILFNFFVRTEHNSFSIWSVLAYFALIIYILTPWGSYFLLKSNFKNNKLIKLLATVLGVAFAVFFIVSLKNDIGLHWFLLFTPFIFLLFSFLDDATQQKLFKYNIIFSFVHIVVLVTFLLLPLELAKEHKKYSDIVMFTHPQKICQEIENDKPLFTYSYSTASLLSYACKRDVFVLFNNSKYGRFDDKLVNIKELSNKDINLFHKKAIDETQLKEVCSSYEIESFAVDGASFYKATCKNFNYETYKKEYIDYANEHFYNIPKWLPQGECYFKERYY